MISPTSVLIVDDHQMFREGIRKAVDAEPDFKVIGEAPTADMALGLLSRNTAEIVILDIRMPGVSGVDLARTIRKRWPDVKILILSGYDFDQYVRALARIGIHGYLLKDAPQSRLIEALREIVAGGVVLPPKIASKVMEDVRERPARFGAPLTVREVGILEQVSQGMKNAQIAKSLKISVRTVENHVAAIVAKLGANNRMDAVRIAVERGLLP